MFFLSYLMFFSIQWKLFKSNSKGIGKIITDNWKTVIKIDT